MPGNPIHHQSLILVPKQSGSVLFYFAFHYCYGSRIDQFVDFANMQLLEKAMKTSLILSVQKERKNKKGFPPGAIIWTPMAWETRDGDNPPQVLASEPLLIHSSLTLCQTIIFALDSLNLFY